MSVSFAIIATNKYISFVDQLLRSIENYSCIPYEIVLFTDGHHVAKTENIQHEPWPMVTYHRYHTISNYYGWKTDYLYYIDVDMRFCYPVGVELYTKSLTAVLHPGYYNAHFKNQPLVRDKNSLFYVPYREDNKYCAGGFQGGKTEDYLAVCRKLANMIDKSESIPEWHDESCWNWYINEVGKDKVTTLSPSYCYPESWSIPFHPKLLALNKNHKEMRS